MDEQTEAQLLNRINSYLDAIEGSAETAGGFVIEQTPLLAQEYLAWVFWDAVFCAACWLVPLLLMGILMFKLIRAAWKFDNREDNGPDDPPATVIAITVAIFLTGFPTAAVVCYARDAMRVSVAPRVVLLEKATTLLHRAPGAQAK